MMLTSIFSFPHEVFYPVYPFPISPFWDRPKFKEAADNNCNVAIEGF